MSSSTVSSAVLRGRRPPLSIRTSRSRVSGIVSLSHGILRGRASIAMTDFYGRYPSVYMRKVKFAQDSFDEKLGAILTEFPILDVSFAILQPDGRLRHSLWYLPPT